MKCLPDTTARQRVVVNAAAAGGPSVCTVAAVTGNYVVVDWVIWSYDADPANGLLTLSDGTIAVPFVITKGGPGEIMFGDRGLLFTKGAALTVTLADGGAAKKLNIQYR